MRRLPWLVLLIPLVLVVFVSAQSAQQPGPDVYLPLVFQGEGPGIPTATLAPNATPTNTATPSPTRASTSTMTPTASATLTPSNTPTASATPTRTPIPATLIPGGDFETLRELWVQNATQPIQTSPLAHSGLHAALLQPPADALASVEISRTVEVVVPVDQPYLSYWTYIESLQPVCSTSPSAEGGSLIATRNGETKFQNFAMCAATSGRWARRTLDLRVWAGQSVGLLVIAYAPSGGAKLYIDDIGFQAAPDPQ